jgi:putative peptidoglycan lipid II flippase
VAGVSLNVLLSFYLTGILKTPGFLGSFMIRILDLQRVENISVTGLPLAFSIAVIFQFSLLLFFLYKKIGDFRIKEISHSFIKVLIATIFVAVFAYLTRQFVAGFVDMRTFMGIFTQGVLAGIVGILTYLLLSFILKSPELKIIKSAVLRQFTKS